jgi:hypothetical protein
MIHFCNFIIFLDFGILSMHVNQMLVQYLESIMDHSFPQVEFHYLFRFWDTEYACQPDVSAMFEEHYGSLLVSSGALVNLKNELQ